MMFPFNTKVCFFIILLFASSQVVWAQKKGKKDKPKREHPTLQQRIDEIVNPYINKEENIGLCIGIIKDDEQLTLGYGSQRKDTAIAINSKTIFEIGSVTKVFTALAFAAAAKSDSLKPYTKLSEVFNDTLLSSNMAAVNFFQLASHTSGLPRRPFNLNFNDFDELNPYANYNISKLHSFLGSYNQVSQHKRNSFKYSNLGMGLLGHGLELKMNTSLQNIYEHFIFSKLGMNSTFIERQEAYENTAQGHDFAGTEVDYWEFASMQGTGALKSNMSDLLTFVKANIFTLRQPELSQAFYWTHKIHAKTSTRKVYSGLGWQIFKGGKKEYKVYTHSGSTAGFRCYVAFVKEEKIGVVVLANNAPTANTESTADLIGIKLLELLSDPNSKKKNAEYN